MTEGPIGVSFPEALQPLLRASRDDREVLALQASIEEAEALSDETAAEGAYRKLLTISRATFGPHHLVVAAVASRLAGVLQKRMKFAEAKRLHRSGRGPCFISREANLSTDNQSPFAFDLSAVASPLKCSLRYERSALATRESLLSLGHPDAAASLSGLCSALEALEQHAEAEAALRRKLNQSSRRHKDSAKLAAICSDRIR